MKKNLRQLISIIKKSTGLQDIKPNEEQCLGLRFDNDVEINIEVNDQENSFDIYAAIDEINIKKDQQIIELCLKANLFWQMTKGATISLADNGLIIIARRENLLQCEPQEVMNNINDIVDTIILWRKIIKKSRQEKQNLMDLMSMSKKLNS